jgi:hypothetical protein
VEELQVAKDVLLDFVGVGFGVELLQVGDELGDGVLAIAAGDDFKAGAVETQGAFGHEENFLAPVLAEADAWGELRFAVGLGNHEEADGRQFTVESEKRKVVNVSEGKGVRLRLQLRASPSSNRKSPAL